MILKSNTLFGKVKKHAQVWSFAKLGEEVRPKGVKNKTPYDHFYFAGICCTDSQTFKTWKYVEK